MVRLPAKSRLPVVGAFAKSIACGGKGYFTKTGPITICKVFGRDVDGLLSKRVPLQGKFLTMSFTFALIL